MFSKLKTTTAAYFRGHVGASVIQGKMRLAVSTISRVPLLPSLALIEFFFFFGAVTPLGLMTSPSQSHTVGQPRAQRN